MHWIMVGVLIWIGLAIAPVVLGLALVVLPFVFFIPVGAILGFALTDGSGGAWAGGLVGGFIAYGIVSAIMD